MRRILPMLLVAGLLITQGIVHGLWTGRWNVSEDLTSAAARLEQVPMSIGDWTATSLKPMDDRQVQQAGFVGYVIRSYTHRASGATVTILLACGRSGPLSVHTPDVCYRGAGYEPASPIVKRTEQRDQTTLGEFWAGQFAKPGGLNPTQLRVLWCWNGGKSWQAPDHPRVAFAGLPVLYKLYVTHEMLGGDEQAEKTCSDFLAQLLPELTSRLFPTRDVSVTDRSGAPAKPSNGVRTYVAL